MIKIENLSKVFRTEEVETVALNNVHMQVKEGEYFAEVFNLNHSFMFFIVIVLFYLPQRTLSFTEFLYFSQCDSVLLCGEIESFTLNTNHRIFIRYLPSLHDHYAHNHQQGHKAGHYIIRYGATYGCCELAHP